VLPALFLLGSSEESVDETCHFANDLASKVARYLAYSSSKDQLAGLTEEARKLALRRFRLLQPHLEDHRPLKAVAAAARIPFLTLNAGCRCIGSLA
jgi:hypothetical protein